MENRISVLEETLAYERKAYERLYNQHLSDTADLMVIIEKLKKEAAEKKGVPTRGYMITINDKHDVPQKHFQHDCDNCKFVGTTTISRKPADKWIDTIEDIYICVNDNGGSIVRRRSDEGSDYGSFDFDAIGVNTRNPKEDSYEWIFKRLQQDGILKYNFDWNFTERGYRCLYCEEPITPESHEAFGNYPWCDEVCRDVHNERMDFMLKSLCGDDEE